MPLADDVELIRRAAQQMLDAAAAAESAVGKDRWHDGGVGWCQTSGMVHEIETATGGSAIMVLHSAFEEVTDHTAGFDPEVGLAVSAWLYREVRLAERVAKEHPGLAWEPDELAVLVAQRYLRK